MRTTVLAIVLASGMALGAQTIPAPHQVQQVTSGHSVPTTVARPIIKDPAEYDAYVDAVLQTDPVGRMGSLQAFLQQYPGQRSEARRT